MANKQKITIQEAEKSFPVLTFDVKNALKGGCGHCEGWEEEGATVYSQDEYNYLSSQSIWAGGNVCGIGYVPGQTTETDCPTTEDTETTETTENTTDVPIEEEPETTGEPKTTPEPGTTYPGSDEDGETGTMDVVWHTWEEMNALADNGQWKGGFVLGIGYVSSPITVRPQTNEDGTPLDKIAQVTNVASEMLGHASDLTKAYADEASKNWGSVAKVAGVIGKAAGAAGAISEAYMIYTDKNSTGWDWAWWGTKIAAGAVAGVPGYAAALGYERMYELSKELTAQGTLYERDIQQNMRNGSFFLEWGGVRR